MDKVVHFELPVDNMATSRKFFTEVFGWHTEETPDGDYVMANTTETGDDYRPKEPGAINGGLTPRTEDMRTPLIYINVDSIDTTLATIVEHGGSVVTPKTGVGEYGTYARFTDTEGNVLGLWEMPGT